MAKYRDIVNNIFEQTDVSIPPPPLATEIIKQKVQHRRQRGYLQQWEIRAKEKNKHVPGRSYAYIIHEFTRSIEDEYGDPIDIEVKLTISGLRSKGYKGSQYEPSIPPGYDDIYLEWVEPVESNPPGGPLTINDRLKIEEWFDSVEGQDEAYQALEDQDQ